MSYESFTRIILKSYFITEHFSKVCYIHLFSGYMSPEYASEGLFSMKSDVFSFGVLTLEIVSGKRSSGLHRYGDFINLLGHVSLLCPVNYTTCKSNLSLSLSSRSTKVVQLFNRTDVLMASTHYTSIYTFP
jgi:hypothetical protein